MHVRLTSADLTNSPEFLSITQFPDAMRWFKDNQVSNFIDVGEIKLWLTANSHGDNLVARIDFYINKMRFEMFVGELPRGECDYEIVFDDNVNYGKVDKAVAMIQSMAPDNVVTNATKIKLLLNELLRVTVKTR